MGSITIIDSEMTDCEKNSMDLKYIGMYFKIKITRVILP